jgi:hypothetical protein
MIIDLLRDKMLLSSQLLSEYNTHFVNPRVFYPRSSCSTQMASAGTEPDLLDLLEEDAQEDIENHDAELQSGNAHSSGRLKRRYAAATMTDAKDYRRHSRRSHGAADSSPADKDSPSKSTENFYQRPLAEKESNSDLRRRPAHSYSQGSVRGRVIR